MVSEQKCRVCGCTDGDCTDCVRLTGGSCHWIEDDLCSACEFAEFKADNLSEAQRDMLEAIGPKSTFGKPFRGNYKGSRYGISLYNRSACALHRLRLIAYGYDAKAKYHRGGWYVTPFGRKTLRHHAKIRNAA